MSDTIKEGAVDMMTNEGSAEVVVTIQDIPQSDLQPTNSCPCGMPNGQHDTSCACDTANVI